MQDNKQGDASPEIAVNIQERIVQTIRELISAGQEALDYSDGSGKPILQEAIWSAQSKLSEYEAASAPSLPVEEEKAGRWINTKTAFPEKGGHYFCRIGPLKDKACWMRSKIIERHNEGGCEIEWLDERAALTTPSNSEREEEGSHGV